MSHRYLDDALLVKMYKEGVPMKELEAHFDASKRTLQRHILKMGCTPNRKALNPWTEEEEKQLISARKDGFTGMELQAKIPAHTLPGIKGHLIAMRDRGVKIR